MADSTTRPAADERLTPEARPAVTAAFLGWTMDAFDYFLVVMVYADVADEFGVSLTRMARSSPVRSCCAASPT